MSHFLVIYQRSAGKLLDISEFETSAAALQARFEAERSYTREDDVEIVSLSAESREALGRTHARYFQSLEQLAAAIS